MDMLGHDNPSPKLEPDSSPSLVQGLKEPLPRTVAVEKGLAIQTRKRQQVRTIGDIPALAALSVCHRTRHAETLHASVTPGKSENGK
jgi:hypothetical protein